MFHNMTRVPLLCRQQVYTVAKLHTVDKPITFQIYIYNVNQSHQRPKALQNGLQLPGCCRQPSKGTLAQRNVGKYATGAAHTPALWLAARRMPARYCKKHNYMQKDTCRSITGRYCRIVISTTPLEILHDEAAAQISKSVQ